MTKDVYILICFKGPSKQTAPSNLRIPWQIERNDYKTYNDWKLKYVALQIGKWCDHSLQNSHVTRSVNSLSTFTLFCFLWQRCNISGQNLHQGQLLQCSFFSLTFCFKFMGGYIFKTNILLLKISYFVVKNDWRLWKIWDTLFKP